MHTPESREELMAVVRQARQEKIRLQPISCGKNWGFGSNLPEEERAGLLDLSRLRAIRQVNWEEDWVELEPGVTQGALDDLLARHHRTHYFNVTGAGRQTSIIGNSLERGIGYFGSRTEDVLDLEVLLADGSIIWTSGVSNNAFHTGLGPDLKGLFFQSNNGIVIAARFKLRRRPACMGVAMISLLAEQNISTCVDIMGDMRREGLFSTVPHIGNRQRLLSTFGPVGSKTALNLGSTLPEWTGVVPLTGPTKVISPDLGKVDDRFANLVDLALGIPNDFALAGVANAALSEASPNNPDLDSGRAGLIHVTPTCRANGRELSRFLTLFDKIRLNCDYGEVPMTLNLVNSGMIAAIISIPFDRQNSVSSGQAQKFARQLVAACGKEGFVPYRVGIEDASDLEPFNKSRSAALRILQHGLDPECLLAQSKYASLWAAPPPAKTGRSLKKAIRVNKIDLEVCA